jgi:hypothetical protein
MTLQPAETLEEVPATHDEVASNLTTKQSTTHALADSLPLVLKRDSIQLLLQSPRKLFLYWSFANDPRATLRAAFGELAAHYRLAVRLVKVESGEEFLLDAPRERMQWFEVYPRHLYRADVGFHAADRPFVRLLASNEVRTPPDSASHLSADDAEFQLEADDFARLLGGAGYERYARGLTNATGDATSRQSGFVEIIKSAREDADEYPHR